MHRLIRSKRTKAFLRPDLSWTLDMRQAFRLVEILLPEALRKRLNLYDVELYYSFADDRETQWDFSLPVA